MFAVTDVSSREKYYRYLARLNYEGALAADEKIGYLPGYEAVAPPPVMTLCAHCIELCLKSYLLQHGRNEEEVRAYGHHLLEMWNDVKKLAQTKNLRLPSINEHVLGIISDLLENHRLRYGEPSKLGLAPVFGPLSEVCDALLDLCNAPSFSDLAA